MERLMTEPRIAISALRAARAEQPTSSNMNEAMELGALAIELAVARCQSAPHRLKKFDQCPRCLALKRWLAAIGGLDHAFPD